MVSSGEVKLDLHEAVFKNDVGRLKELIAAGDHDINAKDNFGNTPLHLSSMLGFVECTEVLTTYKADTSIKNNSGWTSLAEAVSCGNRTQIKSVLRRAKQQNKESLEQRRPKLVETLNQLKDFKLQLKWEFHSWVPLLSRLLPSDTCKISKKGTNIRMDSTLIEFTDMKWQRGDISFIFNGANLKPNNILVLENEKKVYQKLRQNDIEADLDEEIDYLMSSDIVSAQMSTKPITFVSAQSGWIFKQDKQEIIGEINCAVYNVQGMVLTSKKRREHLSEDDLHKNKAIVEALHRGDESVMENEKTEIEHRPSLPPPPSLQFSWQDYINAAGCPCIGRSMRLAESKKAMKVNVWMSEDFPLTSDLILSVLNVVAPSKHFEKIKDFVSMKLPPGFPVKIEIPVLPTVVARITFQNFEWTTDLDDNLFTVPSDFTEDPFHFPEL